MAAVSRSDTGPFALIPEWVLDREISDRAVRLYGLLARYADKDGESWPSRRTLSERLRCSLASVDRALDELAGAGAIDRGLRYGEKGQTSNLYRVLRVDPSSQVTRGVVTGDQPPLITGDQQNENHVEREPMNDLQEATAPAEVLAFPQETAPTTTQRATGIVTAWWDARDPKPLDKWVAVRAMVKRALEAGWTDEDLAHALNEIAPPIVQWKLTEALERRRRARPGGKLTLTDLQTMHAERGI